MNKKEILFIVHSMPLGGIAKALLGLLNSIDYTKYNISLAVFDDSGIFMESIPKEVYVYPELLKDKDYLLYTPYFKKLLKNNPQKLIKWIPQFIKGCFIRIFQGRERWYYYFEKELLKNTNKIDKHFDAVIAFASEHNIYYAVDYINADKKIGFIHSDYEKSDIKYILLDREYFPKLDVLASISLECVDILKKHFPKLIDKIKYIPNIVSKQAVTKNSLEYQPKEMQDLKYKYLVTTCRMSMYDKGLDFIIEVCRNFKREQKLYKWILIGGGYDYDKIKTIIQEEELQEYLILTGIKINPYPYVKKCDLFVQPSRFEGKSISVDEAKLLGKPILLTNYSTAKDQITHMLDGYICEMNANSIKQAIEYLLKHEEITDKFIDNLSNEKLDNKEEVLNIYRKLL